MTATERLLQEQVDMLVRDLGQSRAFNVLLCAERDALRTELADRESDLRFEFNGRMSAEASETLLRQQNSALALQVAEMRAWQDAVPFVALRCYWELSEPDARWERRKDSISDLDALVAWFTTVGKEVDGAA